MSDKNGNGLADAAALFGKGERRYVVVEAGDVTARLRSLTAAELTRLRNRLDVGDPIHETLLVHTLVDADGKPLLTEGDIGKFAQMDGAVFSGLVRAAIDHTGWNADYDLAVLEGAKKN